MAIPATQIRRGMVLVFEGDRTHHEFHHHTPGNLRAMVQEKLQEPAHREPASSTASARRTKSIDTAYMNSTTWSTSTPTATPTTS